MRAIYEFTNYKNYLNALIATYPNGGRGVYTQLAKSMGVSAVMISQVLKGNRNFSRDKLYLASLFFELNEVETEYLLIMFDMNMSKSEDHMNYIRNKMSELTSLLKVQENQSTISLSEEHNKKFFSSWLYKATLMCLKQETINTRMDLVNELGESEIKINQILIDLEEMKLVAKTENGQYYAKTDGVATPKEKLHLFTESVNLKHLEMSRFIDGVSSEEYSESNLIMVSEEDLADMVRAARRSFKEILQKSTGAGRKKLVLVSLSLLGLSKEKTKATQVITTTAEETPCCN